MKDNNNSSNHYLNLNDVTKDFGFSFSHEEEIITSLPAYTSLQDEIDDVKKRLRAINTIFMPLLINLNKDPDKPMIKWPNRKEILDKQIEKLKQLTDV